METGAGVNSRQAFRDWVTLYSDELYRYTLRRGFGDDAAKDFVQDTFLSAWNGVDRYKGNATVKNWLFVILKNKIIDHFRKQSNRLDLQSFQESESADRYFDDSGHWREGSYPERWSVNLSDTLEVKEFHLVFNRCSASLKELQRAVFFRKYVDGLTSDKICAELEISDSNYWVLLHRAKVQPRACLEKNWLTK